MRQLTITPLSKTAFAPYGNVIETGGVDSFSINSGMASRFHDLANLQFEGDSARPMISIFRCLDFHIPVVVKMMERHPLGTQAFVPLNNQIYLSIVAQDDNGVPVNPCAFLVQGNQGINLRINTWHATLTTLEECGDFLVVDRGGEGNNLEEHYFDEPYVIG